MRSHVEAKLSAALKGSPFSLNQRKTRVTVLEQDPPAFGQDRRHTGEGHRITGVRVTEDAVELTRSSKREIRSLVYNLKKLGFLQLACNRFGGKTAVRTRYRTDRNSHFREDRRLSTERLAVLMLKKYAPDIRVEVRSPALLSLRRRGVQDLELCEGRRAWNVVQRVLSYLWTGRLSPQDEEGHLAIHEQDGSILCRIRSESRLNFFRLSRREAISCVELWHELHGRVASLTIEDTNRYFDPIRESRSRLALAVERIEIRAVHPSSPKPLPLIVAKDEESLPLTPEDDVLALSCRVYRKIDGFHRFTKTDADSTESTQYADSFQRVTRSRPELVTWIDVARRLCVDGLVRLPKLLPEGEKTGFGDVFKLLQVLDDRFAGRRSHYYLIENRFLNKVVQRKDVADLSTADQSRTVQAELLKLLERTFARSLQEKTVSGMVRWQGSLRDNPLRLSSINNALEDACCTFCDLHGKCVWHDTGAKLFRSEATLQLAVVTPRLRQCIAASANPDVWQELFRFGKDICDVTTELLEYSAGQDDKGVKERFHQCLDPDSQAVFKVLFLLRNREAHPLTREMYRDWVTIQSNAAKRLGRRWGKHGPPSGDSILFAAGDLELTELEGTELKVQYLKAACEALKCFGAKASPPAGS